MTIIEQKFEIFDKYDLFIISFKNRLLAKTRINEKGCWIWKGATDRTGYGIMGIKLKDIYRLISVHRLSAYLFLGLDLTREDLKALHRDNICRNRNCWNPEHLYIGTIGDNVQDSLKLKTHRNVRGF